MIVQNRLRPMAIRLQQINSFVLLFVNEVHSHDCLSVADPTGSKIDEFLEIDVIQGVVKVWHLVMIAIGIGIIATIVLCCIMRCRIPRTKQEIEADDVRMQITKQFRKHLNRIPIEGMQLINVLNTIQQYEEDRLIRGTIEVKKSFRDKIILFLRGGERAQSMDAQRNQAGRKSQDVEYGNAATDKLTAGETVKTVDTDVCIEFTEENEPKIDDELFSGDELTLDELIRRKIGDERRRRTLRSIAMEEIYKQRLKNSWFLQKSLKATEDQIDEDILGSCDKLDIISGDTGDLPTSKELEKAQKAEEKSRKKAIEKQKSEEEKLRKLQDKENEKERKKFEKDEEKARKMREKIEKAEMRKTRKLDKKKSINKDDI